MFATKSMPLVALMRSSYAVDSREERVPDRESTHPPNFSKVSGHKSQKEEPAAFHVKSRGAYQMSRILARS